MLKLLLNLALLAAPIALYILIIRPRLKARFVDLYADIDSFWGRLKARLYAFRSFVAATIAAWLAALPEILQGLVGVDFSGVLPDDWKAYVGTGLAIVLIFIRAFATAPREEPAG